MKADQVNLLLDGLDKCKKIQDLISESHEDFKWAWLLSRGEDKALAFSNDVRHEINAAAKAIENIVKMIESLPSRVVLSALAERFANGTAEEAAKCSARFHEVREHAKEIGFTCDPILEITDPTHTFHGHLFALTAITVGQYNTRLLRGKMISDHGSAQVSYDALNGGYKIM